MTQLEFSVPVETWIERSIDLVQGANQWHTGFEFTADWLHGVVHSPPHHNAYGGLTNALKRRGLIEVVGYVQSQRIARNGGLIRKWRVK